MKRKFAAAASASSPSQSLTLAGCSGGADDRKSRPPPAGDRHHHALGLEPGDHARVPDARRRFTRGEPQRHGRAQGVRRRRSTTRWSPPTSPPAPAPTSSRRRTSSSSPPSRTAASCSTSRMSSCRTASSGGLVVRGRRQARTASPTARTRGSCTTTRTCSTQAGVDYPDGSWTWDDYDAAAGRTAQGSAGPRPRGAYQHRWQSARAGLRARADPRRRRARAATSTTSSRTTTACSPCRTPARSSTSTPSTANQLTYQGEFGKQTAAMLPMGTWYVATLHRPAGLRRRRHVRVGHRSDAAARLEHRRHGQRPRSPSVTRPASASTPASTSASRPRPRTFLAFAASEDGCQRARRHRHHPGLHRRRGDRDLLRLSRAHRPTTCRSSPGRPRDVTPENPTSSKTAAIQSILNDMHSAIMSGSHARRRTRSPRRRTASRTRSARQPSPTMTAGSALPGARPATATTAARRQRIMTTVAARRRGRGDGDTAVAAQAPLAADAAQHPDRVELHPPELHRLRRC